MRTGIHNRRGMSAVGFAVTTALLCAAIRDLPVRASLRVNGLDQSVVEASQSGNPARLPSFLIRRAPLIHFPGARNPNRKANFFADSNSPSHWDAGKLYVINSWEQPWLSSGPDLAHLSPATPVDFDNAELKQLWIWVESTYRDRDGKLYGWFHNEVPNVCPPRTDDLPGYPIVVKIGALRSQDNGSHWKDLGFVFEPAQQSITCATGNKWYAGGAGDFSVILDPKTEYFYFFFTNYPAEFSEQGLCVARMRYQDRNAPQGKVWIWRNEKWEQPAKGGHATPIIPATIDITRKDGSTFWGPSIHWNTYLEQYVMLLNRIKDTAWATEGLYISFNPDLSNPKGWSAPQKLMGRDEATHVNPDKPGNGWYIQAMGTGKRETDKIAGRVARLFVDGQSRWEIVFSR